MFRNALTRGSSACDVQDFDNPQESTIEPCDICGQELDDEHACLQSIPSSVLRVQDPRIGSIVVDHYILEEFVCESSTSLVYKARHQLLNSHVAVKISNSSGQRDPFSVVRTSRAAVIAVRLEHPNIVRCIEFSHEPNQQGILIMDWCTGTPLSQVIGKELALTPLRALNLLEGLCDALHYAQTQGVNHINLHPGGILIDNISGYEQAKLLDFGLMKMIAPHTSDIVASSEHFKYASPEERCGHPPDQRSMIYSLGLILLDMLTGRVEALNNQSPGNARLEVPTLLQLRSDMAEAAVIDKILSRCLATKASRRYQNIDELGLAINQAKMEVDRIQRAENLRLTNSKEQRSTLFWVLLLAIIFGICAAWNTIASELH
ncbi:MAG: serine/threonine protein kinase [Cyanobacteria bacterium SZAS LIN-5]|nr:serine/threonine protein kinase [Cyanobacteria bacterium SZAS LIN-5]